MAKAKAKIIYDEDDDILSLSKGMKTKSSIDIGDFIVDVDSSGLVSGLEILNATENLKLTGDQLKGLQKVSMAVTYRPQCIYINLLIQLDKKEKDITIPLAVDVGHTSIKSQRTSFAVA